MSYGWHPSLFIKLVSDSGGYNNGHYDIPELMLELGALKYCARKYCTRHFVRGRLEVSADVTIPY